MKISRNWLKISDIYEKWKRKSDLHITEKHQLDTENPTVDPSCNECYPIWAISVTIEKVLLGFWNIWIKIEPNIFPAGYNLNVVIHYTEIVDAKVDDFISCIRLIEASRHKDNWMNSNIE